ncbi:MAG: transposase [Solirubrobacteraceae bacterium]
MAIKYRDVIKALRRLKAGQQPGYPRFKARQRFDTLTWSFAGNAGGCAISEGRLRLQDVGHIKVKWHRHIPAAAKIATVQVKRTGDRWYACFSLDDVPSRPLAPTGRSVGVDLGIQTFAALSTGELLAGPRANREAAKAVRRAARKVARRKRGSNRRRKAAALLARQREREANRRRDHAHKTARALIARFEVIAVEDLNYRGLAKSMLAKDCNDQGWGGFVALLDEKAEEAARRVVRVDARNTSRTCPDCGTVKAKTLGQRVHQCACGCVLDRDVADSR